LGSGLKMSGHAWHKPFGLLRCGLVAVAAGSSFATTDTITLAQAERSLIRLCDQATAGRLSGDPPLMGQIVSAFEQQLTLSRAAGQQVGWEAVEAFRKAADRHRDQRNRQQNVLVRAYDLVLQARPNHRDAAQIEFEAAHEFDIDRPHAGADAADTTEAIRRYEVMIAKYPLFPVVLEAHIRLATLASLTKRVDQCKRELEFIVGTPYEEIRGPRPMSVAQYRERFGDIPDSSFKTMDTLERARDEHETLRHRTTGCISRIPVKHPPPSGTPRSHTRGAERRLPPTNENRLTCGVR